MIRAPLILSLLLALTACAQTDVALDDPQTVAAPAEQAAETPPPDEVASSQPPGSITESVSVESEAAKLTTKKAASKTSAKGCNDPANFPSWLAEFKQEALAKGITPQTIKLALDGVKYDRSVVMKDRNQDHFSRPFDEFADSKVGGFQLVSGRAKLDSNRKLFAAIEKRYGVPGAVLTAFWGLESYYGTFTGNSDVIRSVATLAFDCRRPELFRPQLMSALLLVQKGVLTPKQMRGAWAGEMGQTQFMASDYLESAIDFDGDGKRLLKSSKADALASTANLLAKWGWQRGQPWIEEVRIPKQMDWKQADLAVKHPRSYWAAQGVTKASGKALAADGLQASLLLPMGRNGPAFLAYPNFRIYLRWNESLIYSLTAAYFATRLQGAPSFKDGNARVADIDYDDIVKLQKLLRARGYDVGDVDGKLGAKTRAAIKDMQLKLGYPPDSYPTPDFIKKLQQS